MIVFVVLLQASPKNASPKKEMLQNLTKESLLSRYGEKLLISVTWMWDGNL